MGLDLGARDGHVERGGDAFAGDVTNDDGQTVRVDQEEVEEVAADGFGRGHLGVDVEVGALGEGRKDAWHQRVLNGAGGVELFLEGGQLLAVAHGVHHLGASGGL